jgi:NADH:ubiquinone oxidoreductase subunit
MGILSEIFTWWNGTTLSTRLWTQRNGRFMGKDEFGNAYYEQIKGVGPLGKPSRWVIYNGEADASRVSPEWHGWLHFTFDVPPTKEEFHPRPWQRAPVGNLTGSPEAYHPAGSIAVPGRPKTPIDYEPWKAD